MGVLGLLRTPTKPLPPLTQFKDILSQIDHQVGRVASVRERAAILIEKMESDDERS